MSPSQQIFVRNISVVLRLLQIIKGKRNFKLIDQGGDDGMLGLLGLDRYLVLFTNEANVDVDDNEDIFVVDYSIIKS